MRALQVTGNGPPGEVLQVVDTDVPEPGPGEMRIKVSAASLNFNDEVTEERARRMTEQFATMPKDAFGRHRYDPADFDWTYPDIAAEFGDDVRRYSVAAEAH